MSAATDGLLAGSGPNAQQIGIRAEAALTTNAAFLALQSPTAAQTLAQVQALTRQSSGIIRVMLGEYDTTSGT